MGFTIVELVIVIAVIAILAGVLIPTFKSVVESAHHSNALQIAKNQMTADTLKYASYGGKIPDDTVYEVDGYYFKVVDNALVEITKEEYDSLFIEIPKNIIYLIPDGAGFGTYDIANAYKKKYSQFAVNGIVDGIKDTVDFS